MATPFESRDIADAFVALDLSDAQPPSTDVTNPTRAILPPSTTKNETKPKLGFLDLPPEIRLQIYDLLLVGRWARIALAPDFLTLSTVTKLPLLHYVYLEPAIIRTCRLIYREAIEVFYHGNVFKVSLPERMFQLMVRAGSENIKLVTSLVMFVPDSANLAPWVALLEALSEEATGLRSVVVNWGNDNADDISHRVHQKRGLGDNLMFVRALAKLRGIEVLRIKGFYAKNWPSYLATETKALVLAQCGYHVAGIQWASNTRKGRRNMRNLRHFNQYQEETEYLFP